MNRITPTGWGNQRGTPVKQLGSTRAVLEAMGWKGILIVAGYDAADALMQAYCDAGKTVGEARDVELVFASAGPNALYELPPETVLGVDVDAYRALPVEQWAECQKIISKRFKTVFWG